ncbi:MAG: M67 family metallopeptidase [Gammaproteobacteria bacterium]|nr:M67 family metallopeptidase [Gammaproteobacteria bacterium]
MNRISLPAPMREELAAIAVDGYPYETCGVLVGACADDGVRVEKVFQARNLNTERARDRYVLDPDDLMSADLAAREAGLEIVGFWHTHPDHPARPSETDREAAWDGYSYIILSVSGSRVEDLRSWRLNGEGFVEEQVAA